ncbi:hypothetical protein [Actinocatenispora rupis]|uniref:Uncharacterized protein n=1 Tax=Actinocatenispora rupis TaxID=519421 RepID=A0A8J3JCX6_9ACTN|nr:hypothetical protein [Actinocatenispora rupis]GID16105.1 hypothetical protein Aru02nite_69940 [Actinocatenispora rupis]
MRRWLGTVHPALLAAVVAVVTVLTVVVGLALTGPSGAGGDHPKPSGTPKAHGSAAPGGLPAGFEVGVSHGQHSIDPGMDEDANARAMTLLRRLGPVQNEYVMGWGPQNPEPSPGKYDWESLDGRMALIGRSGGLPVVTLAAAPDWMKGGKAGRTDWNTLAVAPTPAHYADFARLAVAVATRYPQVRYFQVWDAMLGFWSDADNRWDATAYTTFYNTVYDALKKHDPTLNVGGPGTPLDVWHHPNSDQRSAVRGGWGTADQRGLTAVEYWLAHKHGAQFLTVGVDATTKDGYHPPADQGAQRYTALGAWLKQRTDLPLWWANVDASVRKGSPAATPDSLRTTLTGMKDGGARVALFHGPQCDGGDFPCAWTATDTADGGRPTPVTPVLTDFSAR